MHTKSPLIVCWGMGQDSTGMLVGRWERGIKPKLIITADVGSERPETFSFRPIFDEWLESVGFPRSVKVRYQPSDYKHWPTYHTILENCLTNVSCLRVGLRVSHLFIQNGRLTPSTNTFLSCPGPGSGEPKEGRSAKPLASIPRRMRNASVNAVVTRSPFRQSN
jgi:hypothetical protein